MDQSVHAEYLSIIGKQHHLEHTMMSRMASCWTYKYVLEFRCGVNGDTSK
jgi:hypothetical protein